MLVYMATGLLPDEATRSAQQQKQAEEFVVKHGVLHHLWWRPVNANIELIEQIYVPAEL